MAFSINSIQSFTLVSRPGSRQVAGTLDNRLSVNRTGGGADSATVNSSRSPDKLAERTATLRLSSSISTLNTRESFVQQQVNTVNALIIKAREIDRETDPTRRESLADDATELVTGANEDFAAAVEDDSTFTENQEVFVRVEQGSDPGDSSGTFTSSIAGVQSLSDLGVTDSLSFSSANIDTTIETLENARGSLANKLQSFESTRADIATEVNTRGVNATLRSDLESQDSIEQVASRLAQEIDSSTQQLLASSNVEQLDVGALLADQAEEDDEASDSSSATA